MNSEPILEGGCLCGAIRYSISGTPFAAEYCHCSMCRKSAGAPFVNWMDFRKDQITWTNGRPSEYHSSTNAKRGFCPDCGSTLSFRDTEHPEYFTLTIASLDAPNLVEPTYHIYTDDQLTWLKIDDGCERFSRGQIKK
jgi:hypothetical protein